MAKVGEHTARNLVLVLREIVFHGRADRKAFTLCNRSEVLRNRLQDFLVNGCGVSQRPRIFGYVEERRIG